MSSGLQAHACARDTAWHRDAEMCRKNLSAWDKTNAARVGRSLEMAIAAKVEDHAEHVRWWDETVRGAGGDALSPSWDNGISAADALRETGIGKRASRQSHHGGSDHPPFFPARKAFAPPPRPRPEPAPGAPLGSP